jgi:hypothetical protein
MGVPRMSAPVCVENHTAKLSLRRSRNRLSRMSTKIGKAKYLAKSSHTSTVGLPSRHPSSRCST